MNHKIIMSKQVHLDISHPAWLLFGVLFFLMVTNAAYAGKPTVNTIAAKNVTTTTATLYGTYSNGGGLESAYCFQYGTTTSYGNTTSFIKKSATSSDKTFTVTADISGLTPNTTYHYRLVASTSDGVVQGNDRTFTTDGEAHIAPTASTLSATGVGSTSATLRGEYTNGSGQRSAYLFEYGPTSSYGNTTSPVTNSATSSSRTFTVSETVTGLMAGTTYHYRIVAQTQDGQTAEGSDRTFTTDDPEPEVTTMAALEVTENSAQLRGVFTNGGGQRSSYYFQYGTNTNYDKATTSYSKAATTNNASFVVDETVSGLQDNTTYYYRLVVTTAKGTYYGNNLKFTTLESTSGSCTLPDVSKSSVYYEPTCFLYSRGIISGSEIDGNMNVEDQVKRAHLAKIAFRGVYSLKERSVPTTVPSDNYPTVYGDLTDNSTYYYQAARALLYLEYGDGVTPFDRNRLLFAPEEPITRLHSLKVLMETFNIQPDLSGSNNPFGSDADVVSIANNNPRMMGYIRKAASLGIITTANSQFRPYDNCLRGEAFIMLARIIKLVEDGDISDPNPGQADYFEPLNITLKTISLGISMPMGNFQHYTKSSFAFPGTVPLTFAHTYNSYNTTLPEIFYGENSSREAYLPLGDGWSHNYHSFVTSVDGQAIVHWGGGRIDVYAISGSAWKPVSLGVYDDFSINDNTIYIKTKQQLTYCFGTKKNGVAYLSSVTDRNGNKLTISYENGEHDMPRISSVSNGNRSFSFSYLSGTNLLTSVRDPLGRSIQFAYTKNNQTGRYLLTAFTDAKNQETTYYYGDDAKISTSKLLTKIQLPKGNYIENEFDANRRLSKTINGINGVPTTQTSVSVATAFAGKVTTTSEVKVDRGSESSSYNFTYNANNQMTNMTGEEGLYVSNTYNSSRHPQLPTAIKSNTTQVSNISYDSQGNVTEISVEGDGTLTTTMTYDDMNNLTSVTDPMGNKTTYSYDSNGNLIQISEPEDVTTRFTVNSKGLPTEVTNALGIKTTFDYNTYGNLTKTTMPALDLTYSVNYDDASRTTSVTDALGRISKYTYDNNDNLTSETDALGHTTHYDYDANDNLTSITNAKGGITSLSYDNATDWLTSMSFVGANKQFNYNSDGTLNSFTKPDGTSLSYNYDNLGRMTSNGVNSFSYDDKQRLSSITGNGKTLSFTYDGFNRISGTSFEGHSNSYSYDKNGNRTKLNNTAYSYDRLDRLASVEFKGKIISYTYRKDNQLSQVSYPNGMTTTYKYDVAGRMTNKTTSLNNGTVIASYDFTLDKFGNIIKQSAQEPYSNLVMTNEDTHYTYNDGNRITKAGDINFTFDANGNTAKRGSENYSWDESDHLTSSGSTNITYDPQGLIATYGDITFTTDPLGIGYILSDSKSGAEYIYGNGLEARVKDGTVSFYVTDVRGSVVAIVDDNGKVTHKYQYDDFGRVTQKEEADYNPFQYVGKSGVMYLNDHLYYMRARHYDPTIGRFLSEDPVWSTNLYPYADNNPIMGIDPKGEKYSEILGDGLDYMAAENYNVLSTTSSELFNLEAGVLAGKIKTSVKDAAGKAATKTAGKAAAKTAGNAATKTAGKAVAKTAGASTPTVANGLVGSQVKSGGPAKINFLEHIPTNTIETAYKTIKNWDSSQTFAQMADIAESISKDGVSSVVKLTYHGPCKELVDYASQWGVSEAIKGYGMLIDQTNFEQWAEKQFEKKYVKDYSK